MFQLHSYEPLGKQASVGSDSRAVLVRLICMRSSVSRDYNTTEVLWTDSVSQPGFHAAAVTAATCFHSSCRSHELTEAKTG